MFSHLLAGVAGFAFAISAVPASAETVVTRYADANGLPCQIVADRAAVGVNLPENAVIACQGADRTVYRLVVKDGEEIDVHVHARD